MMYKTLRFYIFILIVSLTPTILLAQSSQPISPPDLPFVDTAERVAAINETLSAFQQYKYIGRIPINVPTVVEEPFDDAFIERAEFGVVEEEGGTFVPNLFIRNQETIPFTITSNQTSGSDRNLIDDRFNTYTAYALPLEGQGSVKITLTAEKPVVSSSLVLNLDRHVALPSSIEIRASNGFGEQIVYAKSKMTSRTVRFPETVASQWIISLTYIQPLRISELTLSQEGASKVTQNLRFLAQPGKSYSIYFNPDRSAGLITGESGNLRDDREVRKLSSTRPLSNPNYVRADIDEDGIPDQLDNCISVENTNQLDVDNNGRGDACDDFDRDGLINSIDNCPNLPNAYQADEDGDGIGDLCDEEESRLTERYTWVPFVGIGTAALVLLVLFGSALRSMQSAKNNDQPPPEGVGEGAETETHEVPESEIENVGDSSQGDNTELPLK